MFPNPFNLANLDGTNGFVINGIDENDYSGSSVSSAGDVNGDNIDDIIIGARYADPNGKSSAGESYVVFGSNNPAARLNLSNLDGRNGFVVNGIDENDYSGQSVSNAGDVNNDGIDDIIIGASDADPNRQRDAGESYIVFGRSNTAARLNLSNLNRRNGFVINGIDSYGESGKSVSNAGDVNGDGIDDIIIGASGADPSGKDRARKSYVVFGSSNPAASLNLADLDGTNGFVINGIDNEDRSGYSVSNAGDVNGDGIDDIIIGAYAADPRRKSYAGESYIVFGSNNPAASLNLADLDGTNGFVINGIDENDRSGYSVSNAGDVNNDGIDDIIIGAYAADSDGKNGAGESYIVFGRSNPAARLNLANLNGTNGFVINGIDVSDVSGFSVSSAGDVNGDGIDDIIIGASGADPDGKDRAGESYVVFGSNSGFAASLNLSDLDGNNGFVLDGINRRDYSGVSVSNAGDVNGDSIDDIIIGAYLADPDGKDLAGESYVVFGVSSRSEPNDVRSEPNIITNPTVNILENKTAVVDIDATDDIDTEGSGLTYSIADGNDSALFSIDADTGELSFNQAADFEMPGDTNRDNEYLVGVTVGNSDNLSDTQNFRVAINDVSETPDDINGTNGDDTIRGTLEDDVINGLAGSDRLIGKSGDDTLNGDSGNDFLTGNAGNDLLNGGEDDDLLVAIGGSDTLNGDGGSDRVISKGGIHVLNGGDGNDTLTSANGSDTLRGGAGNDVLRGGEGQDLFILAAEEGTDLIQDFYIGDDTIGLAGGIEFDDLSFDGRDIIFDNQILATIRFDTYLLNESYFTTV